MPRWNLITYIRGIYIKGSYIAHYVISQTIRRLKHDRRRQNSLGGGKKICPNMISPCPPKKGLHQKLQPIFKNDSIVYYDRFVYN